MFESLNQKTKTFQFFPMFVKLERIGMCLLGEISDATCNRVGR